MKNGYIINVGVLNTPAFNFSQKKCTCNQIFVIIDSPQNNLTKEDLIQVHYNNINKLLNLKGIRVKNTHF